MAKPGGKKKRASVAAEPSAEAPAASATPERTLLDAPPVGPARQRALVVLGVWIVLQILIPLRYYLGDDLYDERFAWRMFSAVRVQECTMTVSELRDGHETPLALQSMLAAPWVDLVRRNRPAVVRELLSWRCREGEAPTSVAVVNTCADAEGRPLPAVTREMSCADRRYEEHAAEPPPEGTPR